jgi:hypothetical protein
MAVSSERRPTVPGVIDTLSAGFNLVNRRPWLLAVPVLLDLFLWFGPRLSVAPLIADFLRVTATPADLSPDYVQAIDQARQALTLMGGQLNLMGLLAAGFLGLPSLISITALGTDFLPAGQVAFQISSGLAAIPVVLLLMVLSVWIAALYLASLAQTIREGHVTRPTLVRQVWWMGWRLTMWLGFILAIAIIAGFPAMLALGVAAVVNTDLASFFTGLVWLAVMWVAVYMFFVVPSVSLGQAGVGRSIWNSLNVVRRNLGSALGLVVVINLIQRGLPMIWDMFAADAWALPISIVGNAYIGTGLMAACMIFYGQRFALWQMAVRGRAAQAPPLEEKTDSAGGSVQG